MAADRRESFEGVALVVIVSALWCALVTIVWWVAGAAPPALRQGPPAADIFALKA